ncbi:MAG: sporulation protein YqfD [Defluviitaleaceae bacterium]|nr:sporulation protein YqfD [Defluviitaleaceae bacterium]
MFLKVWNFLAGYVKIEVSGFSVERFVSQAIAAGVIFWDMRRDGAKFYAHISRKHFSAAEFFAQKTGTKVAALGFYGLPQILTHLKRRLFLLIGGFLFAAGMVFLTSFVWRIDIEGTHRINYTDITAFLEQKGLYIGSFRYGFDYREIEDAMRLQFSDIAWVSFSITGTRAVVSIAESIVPTEIIDTSLPADVVAVKDAIIVYIATTAGQPQFRAGDVVAAGETIVAGQLVLGSAEEGNLSYAYTHAISEVWGRVYYTMDFEIPLTYFEKTFTNRVSRGYTINIGNFSFDLPRIFRGDDFVYYETIERRWQASIGENYPLPLSHTTTLQYELVRHLRNRSVDVAKDFAIEFANRRIAEEIGEDNEIVDKQIVFNEGERSLTAQVFLITIERIDQTQSIQPAQVIREENDE